jgi:hypothetical protein
MDISNFYTGIKTKEGVKVFLGDKLTGQFYFPMVVQYNFKENKYVTIATGKAKSPYRTYPIENLAELPGLRIISNSLLHQSVQVSDLVKITVQNIKESIFTIGDIVRVIEVNEWDIIVESLTDLNIKATIQYHDFLEMWRFED